MIDFFGWIKIIESTYEIDEEHLDEIMAQIQNYVEEFREINCFITVHDVNYISVLNTYGSRNHKWGGYLSGNYDPLLDIFKFVGKVAPGSYGLLYILDDEEEGYQNECQVFVLKRGNLERAKDPFFSPLIPTVEDPEPN